MNIKGNLKNFSKKYLKFKTKIETNTKLNVSSIHNHFFFLKVNLYIIKILDY